MWIYLCEYIYGEMVVNRESVLGQRLCSLQFAVCSFAECRMLFFFKKLLFFTRIVFELLNK